MVFLIIGYGSIGRRHARNLLSLGHEVILLRHNRGNPNQDGLKECYSFEEVLDKAGSLDGVLICSPTTHHLRDVEMVIEQGLPFLLEKPPAMDLKSTLKIKNLITERGFERYDIAFNLRCYPVLKFIRDFLPAMGRLYAARIAAGSYLPNWRKGVDYRKTTSAKRELGGGVHIELVHEIDYILWMFGLPEKVFGYVNRISDLEISTEDVCASLMLYPDGAIVEMHLDYLSHKNLRGCQIIGEKGTLEWHFVEGRVMYFEQDTNVGLEVFKLNPDYDFNESYLEEIQRFLDIIQEGIPGMVGIGDAVNTMRVLEGIEQASRQGRWIELKQLQG